MSPHRRLPILERSLGEVREGQQRIAAKFEDDLRAMQAEDGPVLTCRKGCNNCCSHPVPISLLEGLLLFRWLVGRGGWTPSLRKQCKSESDKLLGLKYEVWMMSAQPCVMLDAKGLCSVYEARPMLCRTAFSVGDPEDCHPHHMAERHGLLPRGEPQEAFDALQNRALDRLGLARIILPLPTALLFAASIEDGSLSIDSVNETLGAAYRGRL